ncbi:putative serine protease [Phytophthora cinnamomi]|uniref:putative serine protease n=1 Tax=Phytophthora cinnamomi TaxID=4785 RepID=UPI0035599803|nr:putative serine protease [Phytophthora cinnamomi]
MDAGAKIFSFSWGTPGSDYSSQARDLDAFINENPDVLVVVAAGNSGEASITGQRTISSPSGAKNVISVGASLNSASTFAQFGCPNVFNERTVAAFSSAGPTTDGRLKPDVVAPGMSLTSSQSEAPGSTNESSATCSLQGTSQATPVVTGVAVLLYEWLRDGWWKAGRKDSAYAMSSIPASLLKALIIHSGDSLQQRMGALPSSGIASCTSLTTDAIDVKFPDVYQGYGKPNLTNIVYFTGSSGSGNGTDALPSLYFLPNSSENSEPSVAHGGEMIISFTVARDVDLRATVVWTDPPGSTQATSQLQHDLDLIVRVRNGSQTFGPLTADSSTGKDSKNNVEMVLVSYSDLLAAAGGNSSSASTSDHVALGDDGGIMVEAVVYGRSVLLADVQKFAFVASSSAIGSTSGSTATSGKSFWSEWLVPIIVGSVIILLILIALCTRCFHGRGKTGQSARHLEQYPVQTTVAGASYYPACVKSTTSANAPYEDRCPYCPFKTPDSVLMVAHVESVHVHETNEPNTIAVLGGSRVFGLEPTVPVVTMTTSPVPNTDAPPADVQPAADDKQQCPHCRFVAPDAVILVNHLQHIHRQ